MKFERGEDGWITIACLNVIGFKKCWDVEFKGGDGEPDPGWEGWDPENPGSIE